VTKKPDLYYFHASFILFVDLFFCFLCLLSSQTRLVTYTAGEKLDWEIEEEAQKEARENLERGAVPSWMFVKKKEGEEEEDEEVRRTRKGG
jgi:hypothetical protein